jgi:hypothetical protein
MVLHQWWSRPEDAPAGATTVITFSGTGKDVAHG